MAEATIQITLAREASELLEEAREFISHNPECRYGSGDPPYPKCTCGLDECKLEERMRATIDKLAGKEPNPPTVQITEADVRRAVERLFTVSLEIFRDRNGNWPNDFIAARLCDLLGLAKETPCP